MSNTAINTEKNTINETITALYIVKYISIDKQNDFLKKLLEATEKNSEFFNKYFGQSEITIRPDKITKKINAKETDNRDISKHFCDTSKFSDII
ncbi:MAG: hypothetical protein HQ463_07150, partial [Bacteroidetes bacterium]|nr:hypothetical protein [Bacteroidota bacterium]